MNDPSSFAISTPCICPHCSKEIDPCESGNTVSFGNWETEKESVEFLVEVIGKSDLFKVYKEVEGTIIQPRLQTPINKTMRIDLILYPMPKIMGKGWARGVIGIECKKSGVKLNHPLAQSMDYARTVWSLPSGFHFMCEYFFLWPFRAVHGLAASIMEQQRIGTVEYKEYNNPEWTYLRFKCGESRILSYSPFNDSIDVGSTKSGRKSGSR
jgi:hypothetical protein